MVKRIIRNILTTIGLDLTKNLKYDRLTTQIMEKVVDHKSNCIDVGCHKGEMLDLMLKYAPQGTHFAFEPIPDLFDALKVKYPQHSVQLFSSALSDRKGTTSFNFVKNAPAYSGIMKRKYEVKNPDIEEINVKLEVLDHLIPEDKPIRFVKIDVEGAEYGVLKGARQLLTRDKPYVVFEFGLGASDYYFTTPEMMYELLVDECGLRISNLSDWLANKAPLTLSDFKASYENSVDYYFLAHQ